MYKQKTRVDVDNSVTRTTQERLLGIKGWDGNHVKETPGREQRLGSNNNTCM